MKKKMAALVGVTQNNNCTAVDSNDLIRGWRSTQCPLVLRRVWKPMKEPDVVMLLTGVLSGKKK